MRSISLFILLSIATVAAHADWINLTGAETSPNIAEVYVLDDHVKVKLEVYVGNLQSFKELIPDDRIEDKDINRPPLQQRIEQFANNTLKFIDDNSRVLPAQLVRVEQRMRINRKFTSASMIYPYTLEHTAKAPTDQHVLYAEIIYPFEGKPESITMVPSLDQKGAAKVTLGFIAYHKTVPVIDFHVLDAPEKLNLDWSDPWQSSFDNLDLNRHHQSVLMSFLYIEPHEVRHEILIRVKDMENWIELGLRGGEYIEIEELDDLKQRINAFLLEKNPVMIDGQLLEPMLIRSDYINIGVTGIQVQAQPQRLEQSTAIIGVIITYLAEGLPQQVSVAWELFTDQVKRVPATAIDPAGPLPTYLTPDDHVHTWTNFLEHYTPPAVAQVAVKDTVDKITLPVVSIGAIIVAIAAGWWLWQLRRQRLPYMMPLLAVVTAAVIAVVAFPFMKLTIHRPAVMIGQLSTDETRLIMHSLLKNVYLSFEFRDESDVFDKLALSVNGELLEEIYLQNRNSLAVKKAGGAQARVNEIEILEAEAEMSTSDGNGFAVRAKWTAKGSVDHWGNVFVRKNYYDGLLNIQIEDGQWKITDLDLLEEKRIDPYSYTGSAVDSR
ncbi:MAG: hypothetical protein KJO91_04095 [Gammaproteobacteria bacterium]|nr:hypothetical protein [Gammaproteobacteria bacterium]